MHTTYIIQRFGITGNYNKTILTALLLLSLPFRLSAPSKEALIIIDSGPVEPYKKLIQAVGIVETRRDTLAYNPIEKAAGYFQIRPVRLVDYNKRTGSNYSRKDLFNYDISEKIFLYYADKIGPFDFEKIAKNWNGSGHMTKHYWKRIKQYL